MRKQIRYVPPGDGHDESREPWVERNLAAAASVADTEHRFDAVMHLFAWYSGNGHEADASAVLLTLSDLITEQAREWEVAVDFAFIAYAVCHDLKNPDAALDWIRRGHAWLSGEHDIARFYGQTLDLARVELHVEVVQGASTDRILQLMWNLKTLCCVQPGMNSDLFDSVETLFENGLLDRDAAAHFAPMVLHFRRDKAAWKLFKGLGALAQSG